MEIARNGAIHIVRMESRRLVPSPASRPEGATLRQHAAEVLHSTTERIAQAMFTLACLPYEACVSLDAILRTLVRLISRRHRLPRPRRSYIRARVRSAASGCAEARSRSSRRRRR